jgi:hypothetical protein
MIWPASHLEEDPKSPLRRQSVPLVPLGHTLRLKQAAILPQKGGVLSCNKTTTGMVAILQRP